MATRKQKDCLVRCERCGRFFPGWVDMDGDIYALGPSSDQCCNGDSLQEVKANVIDEFADS